MKTKKFKTLPVENGGQMKTWSLSPFENIYTELKKFNEISIGVRYWHSISGFKRRYEVFVDGVLITYSGNMWWALSRYKLEVALIKKAGYFMPITNYNV